MRSGLGLVCAALVLAACSDRPSELAAQWGCGPVEGLKAVSGSAWVLVGEFTETNEAPAAIADIACNLATDGRKLFVGVTEYLGGASDAEIRMMEELDGMIAKGAPIVVEKIGGEERPYSVHARSKAEKVWAEALTAKVRASGADHALLLVSRADAIADAIPPSGERFAGYDPMPTFLEGGVTSLEVAANPIPGAPGPAIRIGREMKGGFHGELALASLTRPVIALAIPESRDRPGAVSVIPGGSAEEEAERRANEILREAQAEIQRLLGQGSMDVTLDPGPPPVPEDNNLPEFEAE